MGIGKKMNEQEKFWSGKFGDSYITRSSQIKLIKNNIFFFKNILKKNKKNIKSLIEFGPNVGNNIFALKKILTKLKKISAVEINKKACKKLSKNFKNIEVINTSVLKFVPKKKFDLVLVKGVLIHLNPKDLNRFYKVLFNSTKKYLLLAEYYNPTPAKVKYRSHKNKLFKRDFAGELLKKYKKLKLIDYGFAYRRDKYPQDDLTWFLLSKK